MTNPQGRCANAPLLAVLADQGLTQDELAAMVNQAIEVLFAVPGNCTDTQVRRWTSGAVTWPHPRYLLALEYSLRVSALDLGFVPRGVSSLDRLAEARRAIQLSGRLLQECDPVLRREFFGAAAGTALNGVSVGTTLRGRIGMSQISMLHADLTELHALDGKFGGGDLVKVAEDRYRRIRGALTSCTYGEQVGRALYSAAGEFATSTGWFAFDSGDQAAAERYYDQALRLALLAVDSILQAHVLIAMAIQSLHAGRPAECVTVARAALEQKAARANPAIAALSHAREGLGLSHGGQSRSAARSFGQAWRSLDRHVDPTTVPVWLTFFDDGELTGLVAQSLLALGDYDGAERAVGDTLAAIDDRWGRNRFLHTVTKARAQLGRRSVEEACATAADALRHAPNLRSQRGVGALHEFRHKVARHATVPAARDFLENSAHLIATRGA